MLYSHTIDNGIGNAAYIVYMTSLRKKFMATTISYFL